MLSSGSRRSLYWGGHGDHWLPRSSAHDRKAAKQGCFFSSLISVSHNIFSWHLMQTDIFFFITVKLTACQRRLCIWLSAVAASSKAVNADIQDGSRWIDRQRQTVGSKRPGVLQCAGEQKGNWEREKERDSQRAADAQSAVASEGEQKPQSMRRPKAAGDGVGGGEGWEREGGREADQIMRRNGGDTTAIQRRERARKEAEQASHKLVNPRWPLLPRSAAGQGGGERGRRSHWGLLEREDVVVVAVGGVGIGMGWCREMIGVIRGLEGSVNHVSTVAARGRRRLISQSSLLNLYTGVKGLECNIRPDGWFLYG